MTTPEQLVFKGAPGSPYSRKMLAYLRYRHIRYRFLVGEHTRAMDLPVPKVSLLPTFYLPNDKGELEAVVDSTPLIRRFEVSFEGRTTLPPDPVLNFLNYLVEDYADEWLTKSMFHYRWYYNADIDMAGTILPLWSNIKAHKEHLKALKQSVCDRQISRLYVVGSNDVTAPVIEDSYKRFLNIFDSLIQKQQFVFGGRPSSSDFGVYAQLTQLVKFDPTPAGICLQETPRVYAWTDLVDDLSGNPANETDWMSVDSVTNTLGELLSEIGRVYAPALLANAQALQAGKEQMETIIDGKPWTQPAFPYQAKCLKWINDEYRSLASVHRQAVDAILADTGCETLIIR